MLLRLGNKGNDANPRVTLNYISGSKAKEDDIESPFGLTVLKTTRGQ
jgi:hypothetical protein